MSLTSEQELLEHEWKVANMSADTRLKLAQARLEPWKVIVSAIGAGIAGIGVVVAAFAAGATWMGLYGMHH